jgi:hypothetical protein
VEIDSWLRAERLGHDVLYDLNNYAQGWIDWNLLVDSTGGPNHLNNFCDAPIVAREDFSRFHLQPKYYYMGHFSKFVPAQSKRIQAGAVGNYQFKRFHPVLHSGLEVGLYPCERSVKQMWVWHRDSGSSGSTNSSLGSLRLAVSGLGETERADNAQPTSANGKIEEPNLIEFCLSKGDAERDYLTIWECPPITTQKDDSRVDRALSFVMLPSPSKKADLQILQLRYDMKPPGAAAGVTIPYCVTLSASGSGLLQLKPCSAQDANQRWVHRPSTGEIRSARSDRQDHCVTAGWPYLSSTAYLTPSNQVAVVVMNEAPVDTYVTLTDASTKSEMVVALHAHAIETIVFTPNKKAKKQRAQ